MILCSLFQACSELYAMTNVWFTSNHTYIILHTIWHQVQATGMCLNWRSLKDKVFNTNPPTTDNMNEAAQQAKFALTQNIYRVQYGMQSLYCDTPHDSDYKTSHIFRMCTVILNKKNKSCSNFKTTQNGSKKKISPFFQTGVSSEVHSLSRHSLLWKMNVHLIHIKAYNLNNHILIGYVCLTLQ